jgi:hypothetical protein
MATCEASTSVILAPARSAMERTTSAPAALSPVATTAQAGKFFQAGSPFGSEIGDSLPVGPACRRHASAEVDEFLFWNVDAEGADSEIGHGGLLSVDRASLG